MVKVKGVKLILPTGWWSQVEDEMTYEAFLSQCKIVGVGSKSDTSDDLEKYYIINDLNAVHYDDVTGEAKFEFTESILFTELNPILLPSGTSDNIELILDISN